MSLRAAALVLSAQQPANNRLKLTKARCHGPHGGTSCHRSALLGWPSQLNLVFCGPSASASGESARRCPYRPQSARAAGRLGAAGSPHFRVGNRPPDARDACPVWPVGARGSGVADRQGRRSYRAGLAFKSCRPAVSTASRRTRRWSRGERASGSVPPGPPVLATAVVGHFSRLSGCLLVAQGSSGRRAARAAARLPGLAFDAAPRREGVAVASS